MVHPWLLLPINDVFSARDGRDGLKTISRYFLVFIAITISMMIICMHPLRENIEHTRNIVTVSFLREARGRPHAGTTPMHRRSNRADGNP